MREFLKQSILKFENSFFSNVVKRGLGMMIPLIIVGGLALALRDFPIMVYQDWLGSGIGQVLYAFLDNIHRGTFGLFSLVMVVALSVSYAMERNENYEYVGMYVLVALGAFGVQLNIGSSSFTFDALGPIGCFPAIVITYLSCMAFTALRKIHWLTLEDYTTGMGGICVPAIQTLLPLTIILVAIAVFNQLLFVLFDVHSLYEFVSTYLCMLMEWIDSDNGFVSGLLYTVMVHLLWFFGIHGSNVLEPVAQNLFAFDGAKIFSKSFYDTFVPMGGCGTTICVWIALLLFFRKGRFKKLAHLASFTVIFNMNELFTFGIPIILNPVLFVPFLLTPVVLYCLCYAATAIGILPMVVQENVWTLPIIFNSYRATESFSGVLVQLLCIAIGVMIYLPFLRMNMRMENLRSKEQVRELVAELQENEILIERPEFLTRGDHLGAVSRLLLKDLKSALRNRELYLLYQPQVSADGRCIGAEALLRWNHPIYGLIYPPLIIYLAEEGKVLPELEDFIISEVAKSIHDIEQKYDGPFKVSVNLTAHSLLWDVDQCIAKYTEQYHVSPEKLWVEITEQDILVQTDVVSKKLSQLRDAGHVLLIDDFGMGHTSLLYLQSNDFGIVKLDGSLVKTITTNKTNQKIVASIIELGQELGVGVIAEYVETEEQKQILEQLGCNWYQGYLYSEPVTLDSFIAYLIERQDNFCKL